MKAEILKQWIQALTSGEYKQGRYALERRPNTMLISNQLVPIGVESQGEIEVCHCYQGVLCDLAAKAGVELRRTYHTHHNEPTTVDTSFGKNQTMGSLPREVLDWAGIPLAGGQYSLLNTLQQDNDQGMDFLYIAGRLSSDMPAQ
jgi:hypothetical protein